MTFRFSIFAAVSTREQAGEEKTSLDDQIKTARAFALRQGGAESTGPYILDGYSRTGYEGLAEAAADIPQLAQLLDDLKADRFDVLIMDNWDRLGDIAQMLRVRFKKVKKQLVSARQSGGVVPVSLYDPYKDDATDINMHVEGIIQSYRINKIRRAWNAGIPARVDRGLHPLSVPFGYRRAGENLPVELVPEQAALIRQMKDWMLAGINYEEIARRADAIMPPVRAKKWSRQVVKKILTNPFYAGIVTFGRYRSRLPVPKTEWRIGQGKHEPLWDEETYHALTSEAQRRMDGRRNYLARYPFSGLTVCGVCEHKISKHGKQPFEYLCCNNKSSHWSKRYEIAVPYLTSALVQGLKHYQAEPQQPVDITPLKHDLAEIQTRRARVQAGYESGLYTPQEAALKLRELEEEGEGILRRIEGAENREQRRAEWTERMGGLQAAVDSLPHTIEHGDPVRVNQMLTALIDRIVLQGDDDVQIVWRE